MKSTLTIIFFVFTSIANAQDQWVLKDSIKGAPRSVASSFVVGGEGYALCGLDGEGFRRKAYSYTYWQDDWDNEPSLGGLNGAGLNRGSASAFAINEKGYICLGQGVTNAFFNDLWEFDPVSDTWTQKASFIGSPRRQSVGFAIDSYGYVGLGVDDTGFQKDMYRYSPATNSWTQLSDFGGTGRKEAVGFTMGGQAYVGTGDDGVMRNDFWQYEPTTDTWIQKADFPGTPRKGAVGWGTFPQAFIATGEDIGFNYTNDVWEYNYFSDTWVQRADFLGSGRTSAIAFVIQGVAFLGSGYNGEFLDDLYAYRRVLDVNELEQYTDVNLYPNPANDNISISVDPTDLVASVITLQGKDITNSIEVNSTMAGFQINRGSLPSGNYLINLTHKEFGSVFQGRIVFL
mgnify:CR=1 FL=1